MALERINKITEEITSNLKEISLLNKSNEEKIDRINKIAREAVKKHRQQVWQAKLPTKLARLRNQIVGLQKEIDNQDTRQGDLQKLKTKQAQVIKELQRNCHHQIILSNTPYGGSRLYDYDDCTPGTSLCLVCQKRKSGYEDTVYLFHPSKEKLVLLPSELRWNFAENLKNVTTSLEERVKRKSVTLITSEKVPWQLLWKPFEEQKSEFADKRRY